jgi:xanthine dehydrogenase accessory factor
LRNCSKEDWNDSASLLDDRQWRVPKEALAMRDVLADVDAWTARGDTVALAMVVSVKRSAPRPPGAKMAINSRGEVSGAVSGGCVEGAVVEVAEKVINGGAPELLHFGIADEEAWDVGLPCGGEIGVWVERYEP